jgi:hypothetical protein
MREPPRVVGGLAYFGGWLSAAVHRSRRAEREVISFTRREQRRRMRELFLRGFAA